LTKTPKNFVCDVCDVKCSNQSIWNRHILTRKHKILINPNADFDKNAKNFECDICTFKCSKKSDWARHILTLKHKILTNPNAQNDQYSELYACDCGKIYKHASTLCAHKKKCNQSNQSNQSNQKLNDKNKIQNEEDYDLEQTKAGTEKELMKIIIKDNNEIKNLMIELFKNGAINGNNNTNIIQNNSHNKSFNLQFFLNETCKNAMNIIDFANSIQLELTDLEKIGELGYIDGISKIIVDNLKLLDITERPVHCSDFKRESLYVKNNENKWEKENEENKNLKKLINSVANKNIPLIQEWKQKYPDSNKCDSAKSTQINKIIMEVMETDHSKKEKIIKNIAKEVIIDKN
jgi:hypothetical protein